MKNNKKLTSCILIIVTTIIAIIVSVYGAFVMSEIGQANNVSRSWVIYYYKYNFLFILVPILLLLIIFWLNWKHKVWKKRYIFLISFIVVVGLLVANIMVPMMFPDRQHDALYISINEADKLLDGKEQVYVVEINNESVAYPRRFIGLPHLAGANIGGEDIVMTYCGLSGLPVVFSEKFEGKSTKFEVLGQTHNNLLLVERESGELIQQITGTAEFSQTELETYPNLEMSWNSYKKLYPKGRVYLYEFDRMIDKRLIASFKPKLKKQFDPKQGPLFPTVDLKDDRLNPKTRVWGIKSGGKQTAYTKKHLNKTPLINTIIGDIPIVIYYDKKYDVITFFKRTINGNTVTIKNIDVYGNSSYGKLERFPSYNGLLWMVWSHFYPETELL